MPPAIDPRSLEWLSRTLAVLVFMVAPGLLGSYLDWRLGTSFLTFIGLAFGMVLGTSLLLMLTRKLAPKPRGRPIPYEDDAPVDDFEQDATPED